MAHTVIQSILGLKIKDKVNNISLMNKIRLRTEKATIVQRFGNLFDEGVQPGEFAQNAGVQNVMILLQNPYVIHDIKESDLDVPSILPMLQYLSDYFQSFLFCLWLVKDNGITMNQAYCYSKIKNSKDVFTAHSRQQLTTKADGSSGLTEFTKNEILQAVHYFNTYFQDSSLPERQSYSWNDSNNIDDAQVPGSLSLNTITDSTVNISVTPAYQADMYAQITRFERARSFINAARTQSDLFMKITYYCSFLEVLFSGNNSEVNYRIRERCSIIIGKTFQERKEIFNTMSAIYNVRSAFIHGAKLDGKKMKAEIIESHSKYMDELCRKVFFELLENHKALFEFKTDEELNMYFIDLIFNMNLDKPN